MKKKMKKFLIPLVCVILLAGCSSISETSGTAIERTSLKKIIKGNTTTTDILTWFGPPDKIIYYSVLNKQNIRQRYMVYVYEYIIKGGMTFAKGYPIANEKISENKNTLLIWINRNTGRVENYIYKKGIPIKQKSTEKTKSVRKNVNHNSNITP